ncbi:DUF6950 family protein [Vibrio navarrensis]|uniref:DUF6950 family protein n=1 Tax=Vibrio navarrensis TaxID=29495 RepID=UPI0013027ADD|nr:hypothetical protein [Vibrio navarrensis]
MKIQKLVSFLEMYQGRPFETGVNDCALFVSDWVRLLTGHDFAEPFRGKYTSDLGSARLMKKLGYKDLYDLVASTLDAHGAKRASPMLAQRGDVVWAKHRETYLCGIALADGVAAIGHDGLLSLPISSIQEAWCIDGEVTE